MIIIWVNHRCSGSMAAMVRMRMMVQNTLHCKVFVDMIIMIIIITYAEREGVEQ